jgi:hypothetical protein
VGNQYLGVVVIAMTIPDFDLRVLDQTDPKVAIAELERVAHV